MMSSQGQEHQKTCSLFQSPSIFTIDIQPPKCLEIKCLFLSFFLTQSVALLYDSLKKPKQPLLLGLNIRMYTLIVKGHKVNHSACRSLFLKYEGKHSSLYSGLPLPLTPDEHTYYCCCSNQLQVTLHLITGSSDLFKFNVNAPLLAFISYGAKCGEISSQVSWVLGYRTGKGADYWKLEGEK